MGKICTDPRSDSTARGSNDLFIGVDNVRPLGSEDDFASSFQIGISSGPCYDGGDGVSTWVPQVYVNYGLPFGDSLHSVSTGLRLSYSRPLFTDDLVWNVAGSAGVRANFNGGEELKGLRGLAAGLDAGASWLYYDDMRVGPRAGVQVTTAGDFGFSAGLDWGWDF